LPVVLLCETENQQALDASHRSLYNVAVDRSVPAHQKATL
jgi:hypothetical protein